MNKIIQISDFQNNKNTGDKSKDFTSEVIHLGESTLSLINDIYLLGTPGISDLDAFEKLQSRVGNIEGYEYLHDFIYNISKKSLDLDPKKMPFFIKTNFDKCSNLEIKKVLDLINKELKRKYITINTKGFLLALRNMCINKLRS